MEFPFLDVLFAFVFSFSQKNTAMNQHFQWSHWKFKLSKLCKNRLVLGHQPFLLCFLRLLHPIPSLPLPSLWHDSSQLLNRGKYSLKRQWAPYPAGSQRECPHGYGRWEDVKTELENEVPGGGNLLQEELPHTLETWWTHLRKGVKSEDLNANSRSWCQTMENTLTLCCLGVSFCLCHVNNSPQRKEMVESKDGCDLEQRSRGKKGTGPWPFWGKEEKNEVSDDFCFPGNNRHSCTGYSRCQG